MKKVFTFLAIAAMVSFAAACNKDDDNKKDNKGGETEYEAPIKIDGNFDDWAKLPAAQVAVAKCATDANWTALKTFKVYADEYFVFMYFEFVSDEVEDRAWVPVHFYINGDGKDTTGGYGDQFTEASSDILLEGAVFADGEFCSYNPGAHKWIGEVGGTGWDWEEILPEGSNLCSGMGSGNAYEVQMIREMYPAGKLADVFSIGMDIQQNWSSVGVLPNVTPDPDNNPNGRSPLLQVTTVK